MRRRLGCIVLMLCLLCGAGLAEEAMEAPSRESFFDDAVFFGDSITDGLRLQVLRVRGQGEECLGKAKFLCATSYTVRMAINNSSGLSDHKLMYRGREVKLFDALRQMECGKVFILLGVNDKLMMTPEKSIEAYGEMLDAFARELSETDVYVQSLTPICKAAESGRFNNNRITRFNDLLAQLCAEKGVHYVDIASNMKDENGYLPRASSSDKQVHLNQTGLNVWLDALNAYVENNYNAELENSEEAESSCDLGDG